MEVLKNSYVRMLVTLPLVFFVHNLEKIYYIRHWLAHNEQTYPMRLSYYLPSMPKPAEFYQNFQVMLILSIIIPSFVVMFAIFIKNQRFIFYLLLLFALSLFMNAIQHIGVALLFKSINPGLFTAIFLLLPFSLIMIKEIKKNWAITELPVQVYYLLPLSLGLPILNFLFHSSMNMIGMF